MRINLYNDLIPDIITQNREKIIRKIYSDLIIFLDPFYEESEISKIDIHAVGTKYDVNGLSIMVEIKFDEDKDYFESIKSRMNRTPELDSGLSFMSLNQEALKSRLQRIFDSGEEKGNTEIMFRYIFSKEEFEMWNPYKTYLEI